MEKVFPQALSSAAQVTERTVVHVLGVVPEVAHAAEVLGHGRVAAPARAGDGLARGTEHAHHLLRGVPVDLVVLGFVVAKPTHVRGAAARRDEPRAPCVVLTPQLLGLGLRRAVDCVAHKDVVLCARAVARDE